MTGAASTSAGRLPAPIWAVVPTWNEADNVGPLCRSLLEVHEDLHVLVVDDDSPDGTWQRVRSLSDEEPRVHLLHRRGEPRGRGWAGLAGFRSALDRGAELVIEMDGDLSHHPDDLPAMLEAIKSADVVVGSRFVRGGEDAERGASRRLISTLAGALIRTVTGLTVADPTSGYRVFRREVLEEIQIENLRVWGPSVVLEILFRVHHAGFDIVEVPITFRERAGGESTFRFRVAMDGLFCVARLGIRRLLGRGVARRRLPE